MTLKEPESPPNANNTITQGTIVIATVAVIVNHRITTLVTLQLRPSKGSTHLNVLKGHKNIFSTMNLSTQHSNRSYSKMKIDTTYQFTSSTLEYTPKFKDFYKDPKKFTSLHIAQN